MVVIPPELIKLYSPSTSCFKFKFNLYNCLFKILLWVLVVIAKWIFSGGGA